MRNVVCVTEYVNVPLLRTALETIIQSCTITEGQNNGTFLDLLINSQLQLPIHSSVDVGTQDNKQNHQFFNENQHCTYDIMDTNRSLKSTKKHKSLSCLGQSKEQFQILEDSPNFPSTSNTMATKATITVELI